MLLMNDSVLTFKENRKQHWFSFSLIARNYLTSFMTDPLDCIDDDVGI